MLLVQLITAAGAGSSDGMTGSGPGRGGYPEDREPSYTRSPTDPKQQMGDEVLTAGDNQRSMDQQTTRRAQTYPGPRINQGRLSGRRGATPFLKVTGSNYYQPSSPSALHCSHLPSITLWDSSTPLLDNGPRGPSVLIFSRN